MCRRVQIAFNLVPNKHDRDLLEQVFEEMILELVRGDKKHKQHAGPKRGLGALKAEVQELQTEVEAEDQYPDDIRKEALQVMTMGFKFIRDCCTE
jgi:transcriptional regulator GlxA family with amidase domain